MSTILVATDFSGPADQALELAVEMARALGDEIEICHVHEVTQRLMPPTLDTAVIPPKPEVIRDAELALAERVDRVRALGLTCQSYSAFGRAAVELINRAEQIRPRLMVIGKRGRSPLSQLLVGSVAERVVRDATCPVLVDPVWPGDPGGGPG